MNEAAIKAYQTAELLTQDLREMHRKCLADTATIESRCAENYILDLLQKAVEVRESLKGVAL